MPTLDTLEQWLIEPLENEHLEFKEAKNQFDTTKLMRYIVAIANEGGGYLVFGVTDKRPRQIVGSNAFPTPEALNKIKAKIVEKFQLRVEIVELLHSNGRVLVFEIPTRPTGQPLSYEGSYLMRSGEDLVPMTPDVLKTIFAEDKQSWFSKPAKVAVSSDDVISLLDTQTYFELLRMPYPTNRDAVLERLQSENFINLKSKGWHISNLAAILLAKKLDEFSTSLARKAPRFIIYDGINKLVTKTEITGQKGYAVGFEGLINFVHSSAPQNQFIEQVIREETKMFPKQAIRELIANALIHQDFLASGTSVMIEMYNDRIEISNPGIPPIQVERFIDEYRSRNEKLADVMRRLYICEEKGSGIDKVISAVEYYQLPAPDFRVGEARTTAILFAHQNFSDMSKSDRIRACYQHCCLLYVSNQRMSNQTLRKRFHMSNSRKETSAVSIIIRATKEIGLIEPDESESDSTRYARYIPFWA